MKKIYVLLSVMVLALMTAGFSYAYWTDTLTVSGTARTGTLDVDIVETDGVESDDYAGGSAAITSGANKLSVTATGLYPGAEFYYYGQIVNNGSIPAVLQSITETLVSGSDALRDEIDFEVTYADTLDLEPGEEIDFTIYVLVHTDAGNEVQNKSITVAWEMVFGQYPIT